MLYEKYDTKTGIVITVNTHLIHIFPEWYELSINFRIDTMIPPYSFWSVFKAYR
jgi:hypothetical protein